VRKRDIRLSAGARRPATAAGLFPRCHEAAPAPTLRMSITDEGAAFLDYSWAILAAVDQAE
jgi:hypothetical protein